jgi:hypothetical protein
MYYSYVEIEYIATSFSPARMDLAVKLLTKLFIFFGGKMIRTREAFKFPVLPLPRA